MGTHKTGSSALQVCFARNIDKLADANIYYPKSRSVEAAKQYKITTGNALKMSQFFTGTLKADAAHHFESDLKAAGTMDILYSSEMFAKFEPTKVKDFIQLAKRYKYKIQCIFFVRSPAGYALSQYSQLIKRNRLTLTFDHYVEKAFALPFSYIKAVSELFGADNIRVENYEAHRNHLAEFFMKNILNKDAKDFNLTTQKINRSLSQFELEYMRHCNLCCNDPIATTYLSDALLYSQPDNANALIVTQSNYDVIKKKCAADLKYINSLGVTPGIKMKDPQIRIGNRTEFKFNVFHKTTITILQKLASDQVNRPKI